MRAGHQRYGNNTETAAAETIATGHELIMVKARLKHGEYLAFVERECGFSERTARYYVAAARSGKKPATVAVLGLKLTGERLETHNKRKELVKTGDVPDDDEVPTDEASLKKIKAVEGVAIALKRLRNIYGADRPEVADKIQDFINSLSGEFATGQGGGQQ